MLEMSSFQWWHLIRYLAFGQTNLFTGIHRINFKRRMGRKLGLESCMHTTLWAFYGKAKRKDVLSSYMCTSIVQFWTNNTGMNPNVKDVVERCLC
jgi:hypothetical protein